MSEIRSSTQTKQSPHTELHLEGAWRVVVLNDPVNLMSYVVLVFKKVFGFDEQTARKHMLEVHEQGRSIVERSERKGRHLAPSLRFALLAGDDVARDRRPGERRGKKQGDQPGTGQPPEEQGQRDCQCDGRSGTGDDLPWQIIAQAMGQRGQGRDAEHRD